MLPDYKSGRTGENILLHRIENTTTLRCRRGSKQSGKQLQNTGLLRRLAKKTGLAPSCNSYFSILIEQRSLTYWFTRNVEFRN